MGTQISPGSYTAGGGIAAEHLFTFDGNNDAGFTWLMQSLRSGNQGEINSAISLWQLAADDLISVVNGLYQAYNRVSQTWSGEAADAFYTEMARVQTFALSCLQSMFGSHAPTQMTMIPATVAGPGGMPSTPSALPAVTTSFGGAALLDRLVGQSAAGQSGAPSGGGSGLVPNSLVDVLYDCIDVLTAAGKLADSVIPNGVWTLVTWVWNQYWQEDAQTKIQFALDVGAQTLTMEFLAGWQPIVALIELLSNNVQGAMQLMFTPTTGKVFMNALAANANQPAHFVTQLANAWANDANALPDALDPSQKTGGNNGNNGNQPTTPGGPTMPKTSPYPTSPVKSPTTSTGSLPTTATGPGRTGTPVGTGGFPTTGTGAGTGTGASGYTPLPLSGTGYKPDASLASFNPNGLGAAGGLGTGAGLDGAGLGAGAGGTGAGDLAGAGIGAAGGAGLGAAGRSTPMMPSGGAGSGKEDKSRNRTAYMSEDEEVWGANGDVTDGVL